VGRILHFDSGSLKTRARLVVRIRLSKIETEPDKGGGVVTTAQTLASSGVDVDGRGRFAAAKKISLPDRNFYTSGKKKI